MKRLVDIVVHALAVLGLCALIGHFVTQHRYSSEPLDDQDNQVYNRRTSI